MNWLVNIEAMDTYSCRDGVRSRKVSTEKLGFYTLLKIELDRFRKFL
jgi:hypothetical protein